MNSSQPNNKSGCKCKNKTLAEVNLELEQIVNKNMDNAKVLLN